ncbi:hypothetical protein D4R78_07280, partial [bacterium]
AGFGLENIDSQRIRRGFPERSFGLTAAGLKFLIVSKRNFKFDSSRRLNNKLFNVKCVMFNAGVLHFTHNILHKLNRAGTQVAKGGRL